MRPARVDDLEAIVQGNLGLARETEGKALDLETVRAGTRALFEDPARGFYLVAERDGRVIGQLCVTFEWSDWRCGNFFWIQSVWVYPEARRLGAYRMLHSRVIDIAHERGDVIGLRLYVMDHNGRAKSTYRSLSMEPTSYQVYESLL